MTAVVIAADDIGMSRGITDQILRCVDRGLIDSVSLVANGSDFSHAAGELRDRPQVRIGVHVNLVEGRPISPPQSVPLLVGPDGRFVHSFGSLCLANVTTTRRRGNDLAAQVERETRAQIESVRAALGPDRPLCLDSHRHIHMIPWVFDVFLRLASELRLISLRLVREPFFLCRGRGAMRAYLGPGIAKHGLLNSLARRARRRLSGSGVAHCDYLIGVLFTGDMTAQAARDALRVVARNRTPVSLVELLFHPGRAMEDERGTWSWAPKLADYYCSPARDREAEELTRVHLPDGFTRALPTLGGHGSVQTGG